MAKGGRKHACHHCPLAAKGGCRQRNGFCAKHQGPCPVCGLTKLKHERCARCPPPLEDEEIEVMTTPPMSPKAKKARMAKPQTPKKTIAAIVPPPVPATPKRAPQPPIDNGDNDDSNDDNDNAPSKRKRSISRFDPAAEESASDEDRSPRKIMTPQSKRRKTPKFVAKGGKCEKKGEDEAKAD